MIPQPSACKAVALPFELPPRGCGTVMAAMSRIGCHCTRSGCRVSSLSESGYWPVPATPIWKTGHWPSLLTGGHVRRKAPGMGILKSWGVTYEEVDEILTAAPSVRGMLFGYVGEWKLRRMLEADPRIEGLGRYDNHDRAKKGDLWIRYRGQEIRIEVKGLQTHSVEKTDAGWSGLFQCDASDRRKIKLPTGHEVETTCLMVGEFDMVAACLFQFGEKWRYAFALNRDLPRSPFARYPPEVREQLIKSGIDITWPLQPPFEPEPFRLLDVIVRERSSGK